MQGSEQGPPGDPQWRTNEQIEYAKAGLRNTSFVAMYFVFMASLPDYPQVIEKTEIAADRKALALASWELFRSANTFDDVERMGLEFLLCRTVDAFDYYLTSILRRIFTERPETLRSSEQVTLREVLERRDMAEFIEWAAERRSTGLGFKGLTGVVKYLQDDLKLPIETGAAEYDRAAELIEVRNIVVHNQGRVSSLFLSRTGRTDLKRGDPFPLTQSYLSDGTESLRWLVLQIDAAVVSKFGFADHSGANVVGGISLPPIAPAGGDSAP